MTACFSSAHEGAARFQRDTHGGEEARLNPVGIERDVVTVNFGVAVGNNVSQWWQLH